MVQHCTRRQAHGEVSEPRFSAAREKPRRSGRSRGAGGDLLRGRAGNEQPDMVRFCFWSTWLSGIAGYTYGVGIWQASGKGAPYGPSPTGMAWGDCDWEDAVNAPGSAQVA
jgi:hypothetical protein